MFELYTEDCEKKGFVAQKKHTYSKLFNQELNIGFYVPRTDGCYICELQKSISNDILNSETLEKFENHLADKTATYSERGQGRAMPPNKNQAMVCFDLQNVIQCPRATFTFITFVTRES